MPPELFENPITLEHKVVSGEDRIKQGKKVDYLEIDRLEFNTGIQVYLVGHALPQKGLTTAQAIWSVNVVKSLITNFVSIFGILLIPFHKRFLEAFTAVGWRAMEPHILKYQYLTPTAQTVYDLLSPLGDRAAKLFSHVVEYDQAYRFRLQDLCSETTRELLLDNPRKEIKYLLALHAKRDYRTMQKKVAMLSHIILLALWIPSVKRAFKVALLRIDFTKLQFDEADRYWAAMKTDYDYFGVKRIPDKNRNT